MPSSMAIDYQTLDRCNKEIRLLRLLPKQGAERTVPQCELSHTSLSKSPDYVALSYVWGDQKQQRVIFVDDHTVQISSKLYEAMVQLQPLPGRQILTIWIDALCINQSDLVEKSWQVGLMNEIYTQSKEVLVWLGPAEGDSDSIMLDLDSLGLQGLECGIERTYVFPQTVTRALRQVIFGPKSAINAYSQQLTKEDPKLFDIKNLWKLRNLFTSMYDMNENSTKPPLPGIQKLFSRPWWGRVWVFQEVALPESSKFICGSQEACGKRLRAAMGLFILLKDILMAGSDMQTDNRCLM